MNGADGRFWHQTDPRRGHYSAVHPRAVRNGFVDLWGTILDERDRNALVVAAENVPSVKGVRDHLAWIDAMSGMVFEAPSDAVNQTKAS